jgi:hypothetical protein
MRKLVARKSFAGTVSSNADDARDPSGYSDPEDGTRTITHGLSKPQSDLIRAGCLTLSTSKHVVQNAELGRNKRA